MSNIELKKKLRLGVIGCGRAFRRYYHRALSDCSEWEYAAFCDSSRERLDWIAKNYPGVPAFNSYGELIGMNALDAVLILTPPETHFDLAIEGLKGDLHVLVEKPMALTSEDAKKMIEVASKKSKHLWVGFNRRHNNTYEEAKNKLESRKADEIRVAAHTLITDPSKWDAFSSFLKKDFEGGGALHDLASHQVDLIPWLFSRELGELRTLELRTEKNHTIYARYELKLEGGLVVECETGHGNKSEEKLEVELDDGKLFAQAGEVKETARLPSSLIRSYFYLKSYLNSAMFKLFDRRSEHVRSFGGQFNSFVRAIRREEFTYTAEKLRSALRSVKAIEAIEKSYREEGSWVSLSSEEEKIYEN